MKTKSAFIILFAILSLHFLAGLGLAYNLVNVYTTSEPIPSNSTCDRAGRITLEFDTNSLLEDGDQITMDLPMGVTLCQDIDLSDPYVIDPLEDSISTYGGVDFHITGTNGTSRIYIDIIGAGPLSSTQVGSDPASKLILQDFLSVEPNTINIDIYGFGGSKVEAYLDSSGDKFTFVPSNPQIAHIVAAPPTATTASAASITSYSATLQGTVNPNGVSTTYWFEYGLTTGYGSTTASTSAGSGFSDISVNALISGLNPDTTYHYRIVATNSAGTSYGDDISFTTSTRYVKVYTTSATIPSNSCGRAGTLTLEFTTGELLEDGDRIHIILDLAHDVCKPIDLVTYAYDPLGDSIATYGGVYFHITGTDVNLVYIDIVGVNPGGTLQVGSTPDSKLILQDLFSTEPNTLYIENEGSCLEDVRVYPYSPGDKFTFFVWGTGYIAHIVPAAPTVTTGSAASVALGSATLQGTVNPNGCVSGSSTAYWFEYGVTTAYGSTTASTSAGESFSDIPVNAPISGLNPDTTYHYRIVATNSAGTSYGDDISFTTSTEGVVEVAPDSSFTTSGPVGGPFTPASKDYILTNTGGSSIDWTASKTQNWVSLSTTSGSLLPDASTTVTVSLNSNAESVPEGTYNDTVTFTNTTNGNGNTTREVILSISAGTGPLPIAERQALIALYHSTDGDHWNHNSGWKDAPLDADGFAMPGTENTWYGITCDEWNPTVLEIDMYSNNLHGTIPPELGNLTNLIGLFLTFNQLTGTIPPEMGNLANLNIIMLDHNQLTGPIPTELMNCTNLYNNQSDFRYNRLYTSHTALRDFLNSKQIGGDWESYQNGTNLPPDQPVLSWPTDGLTGVSLTPTLQTGTFHDPNPGDTHLQTEWEISKNSDFSSPVFYTKSSTYLTSLTVPQLTLLGGTTSYWRARFYDNHLSVSEWSNTYSFTTLTTTNDQNSNGIPDTQENDTVDLDNDGTADIAQDHIKSLNSVVGAGQMGVSCKDDPAVTAIEAIDSIDPETISAVALPFRMPLGLFATRLTVANAGERVQVVVYFSEPADPEATWLKHDTISGWVDYSDHATFSADRTSVTLELKDGDYGDADGVANGIIVEPGGIGLASWLEGLVSDASSGEGIARAEISIRDLVLYTGLTGHYLSMILPGTYQMTVSAQGYGSVTNSSVKVTEGETVTLDVAMAPLSQATKLYFPHVDTTSPWGTEIALINTSSDQTVAGTLNAYGNTGQLIDAMAITLAPHGRRQITISDELTDHTNIGYLVFVANSDRAVGYTKFYVSGQYRVAVPAVREINTGDIYLSHIASDSEWWTGVSLLNTTDSPTTVSIAFDTGQNKSITLNANEHRAFTIAQLFEGQPQPEIHSAVITNASGVVGLELFGSAGGGNQLSGILLKDDTANALYYPHTASDETWWTGIVAYNPSNSASQIHIIPYSEGGTPLTPQSLNIQGKGKYIGTVSQLSLPDGTAWFQINSASPITGFELFGTHDQNQLAGYTGVGISARKGVFAKVEKDGWTGIAFVNIEDTAASVTLTAYDNYGTTVATQTVSLGGYAKEVRLAQEFFSQDIGAATYIGYSSDKELVGFQLNGTWDNMLLDGLPGL